jgi:hypothetical protein
MVPAFTDEAVLPAGRYLTEPAELESRFVDMFPASVTRKALFAGWLKRREAVAALVPVEMEWIDGSFVTAKRDPADIDLATFIQAHHLATLPLRARKEVLKLTVAPFSRLAYGCHSFLVVAFPESHPQHNFYLEGRGYWDRFWSASRSATPKGYLEIRGGS